MYQGDWHPGAAWQCTTMCPGPCSRAARAGGQSHGIHETWEREHLLFRDYLRNHADARYAYARVKDEAAQVWSDDRIAYTEAKTGVILDLLVAAESWARATSWTVTQPRW